jgi:hypothetical protein
MNFSALKPAEKKVLHRDAENKNKMSITKILF